MPIFVAHLCMTKGPKHFKERSRQRYWPPFNLLSLVSLRKSMFVCRSFSLGYIFHLTQIFVFCCNRYASLVSANTVHLLIDVRESLQYDIVRFQPAISIPLQRIKQERDVVRQMIKEAESLLPRHSSPLSVVCLCRRGVDSVEAASLLHDLLNDKTNSNDSYEVCDVQGGLQSWAKDVDPDFPLY